MAIKKKKLADLVKAYREADNLCKMAALQKESLREQILAHFSISNDNDAEKTVSKEGVSVTRIVGAPVGKAKDDLVLKRFAESLPSDFVEIVPESLAIRWDLVQNRPRVTELAAKHGIEIKQNISYRLKLEKQ